MKISPEKNIYHFFSMLVLESNITKKNKFHKIQNNNIRLTKILYIN